jgi:pSer/pThr/pTyr-binding forkhead associated (FHA) protein
MSTSSETIDIQPRSGPPTRLPLAGQNLLIGRKDAAITLDSNAISRRHAEMVKDPFGRWWIRDLGSRNGTYVNGVRVTEAVVKPGDLIQLGDYALTLTPPPEGSGQGSGAPVPPEVANVKVPVVEGEAGRISTLPATETPRLSAAHLSSLSQFGQELLGQEDHTQRLAMLCKLMVQPSFHGRAALVLRASKESFTEPPKPICTPAAAAGYEQWSPYISRTLLRTMLARNEPALASNAPSSHGLPGGAAPDAAELSLSSDVMTISAVAVPIKSENTYTDLLYIVFPPEYGTSEWLALAALAVKEFLQAESTWAARKIGEAHASIEKELTRAHAIQERLVPRNVQIPGVDFAIGFIPCRWVGGDYVDVVPGKDGKVLLTLADVCGKGLPAALIASSLHMMCHTAMRAGTPLPVILQNLNVYLVESLTQGTFVTMLACLLDPVAGTLETINAGHPPGFFVTPSGELSITQTECNMPLGLDASNELISDMTTLEPSTMLMLYSDGLTELPLKGGNLLGEDALGQHLQSLIKSNPTAATNDVARQLSTLLDSLQHGMAQDDRTFLLARRL